MFKLLFHYFLSLWPVFVAFLRFLP